MQWRLRFIVHQRSWKEGKDHSKDVGYGTTLKLSTGLETLRKRNPVEKRYCSGGELVDLHQSRRKWSTTVNQPLWPEVVNQSLKSKFLLYLVHFSSEDVESSDFVVVLDKPIDLCRWHCHRIRYRFTIIKNIAWLISKDTSNNRDNE